VEFAKEDFPRGVTLLIDPTSIVGDTARLSLKRSRFSGYLLQGDSATDPTVVSRHVKQAAEAKGKKAFVVASFPYAWPKDGMAYLRVDQDRRRFIGCAGRRGAGEHSFGDVGDRGS